MDVWGCGEGTGERFAQNCVQPVVQYRGGSVMVWGGISETGKTDLVHIQGNLNGQRYRDEVVQPHGAPIRTTDWAGLCPSRRQCASTPSESGQWFPPAEWNPADGVAGMFPRPQSHWTVMGAGWQGSHGADGSRHYLGTVAGNTNRCVDQHYTGKCGPTHQQHAPTMYCMHQCLWWTYEILMDVPKLR